MHGTLVRTAPGDEAGRAARRSPTTASVALDGGGVILVGERLADGPGRAVRGARLAATHRRPAGLGAAPCRRPRRASRPAACPTCCPAAVRSTDAAARVDLGTVWGGDALPARGRAATATRSSPPPRPASSAALVVGGVDPADLPDPAAARRGARDGRLRGQPGGPRPARSPSAPTWSSRSPRSPRRPARSSNWEGRVRPFGKVLREPDALPDLRVLAGIADELGVDLGFRTVEQARGEMQEIGAWDGARGRGRRRVPGAVARVTPPSRGHVRLLATWKQLIDDGRMLDGEDDLEATARTPVALCRPATLAAARPGRRRAAIRSR